MVSGSSRSAPSMPRAQATSDDGVRPATIIVDRDRCTGIGICESIAPEHFEVGADGVLLVLRQDIDADDLAVVEEAVRSCPALALKLDRVPTQP
jgi:ferredoxin